jgi:hypothetical protein
MCSSANQTIYQATIRSETVEEFTFLFYRLNPLPLALQQVHHKELPGVLTVLSKAVLVAEELPRPVHLIERRISIQLEKIF